MAKLPNKHSVPIMGKYRVWLLSNQNNYSLSCRSVRLRFSSQAICDPMSQRPNTELFSTQFLYAMFLNLVSMLWFMHTIPLFLIFLFQFVIPSHENNKFCTPDAGFIQLVNIHVQAGESNYCIRISFLKIDYKNPRSLGTNVIMNVHDRNLAEHLGTSACVFEMGTTCSCE